ncbi:MAG: YegS/Rv2252/BmrU family lipid kinase [Candidatus Heimdallarchaeota archaeon]|nr:YegS/Rv2252/BmrU family lipid kinase [Candidatus Heimdallarchaeota archaeon]MDH5644905.1 YegS/Rv2252/BmrU family lipid kinase [Candidatus Heimdallarchaeota archaeon]
MNERIKIIYNPTAAGGKSGKIKKKVVKLLDEKEINYQIIETNSPAQAIQLAETAKEEGFTMVCALGGDGTVHEVANGSIRGNIPFSVIPAGSGNDFAMGIGLKTWKDGINTLLNGKKTKISIIKAGDRFCINVFDSGAGAAIAKRAYTSMKWLKGQLKYTILTIRELIFSHKPYHIRLVIDGIETEYHMNILAVGFGQTFGSGMRILPNARFNHDSFQIAVIHSAGKFKLLNILPKVIKGKHTTITNHVEIKTGKKVIMEPLDGRKILGEAEGEVYHEGAIELEVIHEGLELVIPNDWDLENTSYFNR